MFRVVRMPRDLNLDSVVTLDRMLRPNRMQVTASISCRATRPTGPSVQEFSSRRVKGESSPEVLMGSVLW